MHTIAILAPANVIAFELAIGCEIFASITSADGSPVYEVLVCGERASVETPCFQIGVPYGLDRLSMADTIVIPGIDDLNQRVSAAVANALQRAWDNGARLVSICTGAFVLAAVGLLDGRRATTHWQAAGELARRYPAITVVPDILYTDEDRIMTSAGGAAGIDMCLHLVGRDHGQAVAVRAAQRMVAPLHRDGGQAQFIHRDLPGTQSGLASVMEWIVSNIDQAFTVVDLARHARMSPRTFARRFRESTGTTPIQWVMTARVRRAQELLEQSDMRVEQIATACGFESAGNFRARFLKEVGLNPMAYRNRFRLQEPDRPAVRFATA